MSGGVLLEGPWLAPGSSFLDFARAAAPELLPSSPPGLPGSASVAPSGTTIVAFTDQTGLVMAGDRRAMMGTQISSRDIEKVYPADAISAIGVAGTAGIALELVRLFQLELEHYEKIEGAGLSLDGKANRLATMLRGNLGLALQGLAVVPLFGGWDTERGRGRLFSYDITGGRYEEREYHAIGSGGVYARGSLKKLWRPALDPAESIRVALAALIDAADDDAATGGPDLARDILPVVARIDQAGYTRLPDDELTGIVGQILEQRRAAR